MRKLCLIELKIEILLSSCESGINPSGDLSDLLVAVAYYKRQ